MPPARFGRKTTSPASTRWASAAKRWPLSPAWPASKCLPAPRPTSALPSTVSRAGKSSPSSRVREASAPPSGSVTSFQYSCPDEIPQKGFQRGYFRGRHRGPCGPEPPRGELQVHPRRQTAVCHPGDGQLRSAAYAVLGREFSRDLVEVDNREGVYRVWGSSPSPAAAAPAAVCSISISMADMSATAP